MSALLAIGRIARLSQPSATARVIASALLSSLLLPVLESTATAERLPVRTYATGDGLAHARVRRIESDPRGFLWFCTIDGLSRFDGAEFVTYRTGDGLPDPWVTDLLTTRDGVYWVATNDGVVTFDGLTRHIARDDAPAAAQRTRQIFKRVAFEGPPAHRQVRVLLEDRAGRVWAGGRGGLALLDRTGRVPTFRPVVPSPPAMVTSLLEGADGSLWIGTLAGLFERRPSGDVLPEPTAAGAGVRHVRALAADDQGRLWVGHDEGLLVLGPGARAREIVPATARHPRECGVGPSRDRRLRLPTQADDACAVATADGLIDRRVRALSLGSAGQLRVGTVGGLSVVDDPQISSVSHAHGLAEDAINTIAEDRDGNLWLGTDASGAMRMAAFGLVSYYQADGLRHDYVSSLLEDDAGRVIAVSGAYYTINEFEGRRFVPARFNVPRSLPADGFFSALRDHGGAWWVGTAMGVYRFPPTLQLAALARVPPDAHYRLPELSGTDLFPLVEDTRGDIWLIAQLPDHIRLVRWQRATGAIQAFGPTDGLPTLPSRLTIARPAVLETPGGELFFGFREAGLFAYRDGRFEAVLDRGQPIRVSTLHLDRTRRIWIVGVDGSMRRIDDLPTRRLVVDTSIARSLTGANVRCMVEDERGHFYFGTTSGVIEVDPRTGHTWRYTTAEGLAQNEVWSALVTRQGDIWFGTIAGVSRLDPRRVRARLPAPRTLITTVHVNGDPRFVSELGDHEVSGLTLAPGERRVEIGFSALSFAPSERLRYQHRLEGTDGDWSQPSAERIVHYFHLESGRYRFQVRAVTSAALVGDTPAFVEFEILPPLSQRWWFRSALLLSAVLVAFAAHRYRVARLLALERVRMRIAADLHDDIGGSLSRISIQSEVACREAAALGNQPAGRLNEIAESARGLVDALGDVVWSVDPRRDDLASVCRRVREYADDVLTGSGVRWSYVAPANLAHVRLDPQSRRNLFLLLKEGVTNVARHASARSASLEIRLVGHELQAELRDDGRGFDASATDVRSDHHGILSMRARAERLGARLTIDSSPGSGTSMSVRMPILGFWERMSMLLPKRLR
jgi:signal transduction histidine kinase/ligand-binding sensor domain-containing protein